jgi:DNA invertase Pin-like site-specific DNA recombinase
MICTVYARKSTPEEDKHQEEKSVTRQKAEGRAAAEAQGWAVTDTYEDEAISGALGVEHRPGLRALLAAAESTPRPFDVVVMAADDRLMRNQWELAAVLARLYKAGVDLYYYQERRFANLKDAVGRFMEQVRGFGSEFYRESLTRHMVDALKRKAKAGHVHGGRTFGYDNRRVDGHVERVINPDEKQVIERLFRRYAEGAGLRGIAKELNAERLPAPRPSKGGPAGWSSTTIRDILKRRIYRGELVSRWGDEEIRVERPDLRIVPQLLWDAVQERRQQAAQIYLRHSSGKLWGKPASTTESAYLLTGMALCPCGSGLTVRSRSHGRKRAYFYQCRAALEKGSVCDNRMALPLPVTDSAILGYLEGVLLHPDVVAEAIRRLAEPDPTVEPPEERRARLQRELAQVERELANFTEAIAAGGAQVNTVLKGMKLREQRRGELQDTLAHLERQTTALSLDVDALRPQIMALLADWRGLAAKHVQATRQLLRKLLVGRLTFSPAPGGVIRFRGQGTLAPIIGRLELQGVQGLVAPTGFEPVFQSRSPFPQPYQGLRRRHTRKELPRLKHAAESSPKHPGRPSQVRIAGALSQCPLLPTVLPAYESRAGSALFSKGFVTVQRLAHLDNNKSLFSMGEHVPKRKTPRSADEFPLRVRRVVRMESDHTHWVEVRGGLPPKRYNALFSLSIVDKTQFVDQLISKFGMLDKRDRLVAHLREQVHRAAVVPGISSLGWTDDHDAFIFGRKVYRASPSAPSYHFIPTGADAAAAFKPQGSRIAQYRRLKALFLNSRWAQLVLALAAISPFLEIVGAPTLIFHLTGGTGIGKTTLLRVAISVFCNPASPLAVIDFSKDTGNSLDLKLGINRTRFLWTRS